MGANSLGITGPARSVINNGGSDIPAYTRVKITGVRVSGELPVAIASAADGEKGILITQQVIPANGGAGVALDVKKGGNQILTSSAAVTAGVEIDLDDNGNYKTTVGSPVGVAEETLSVAGTFNATLY